MPPSRSLCIHGPTFNSLNNLASHISEQKLNYGCQLVENIEEFKDELLKVEMIPIDRDQPSLEPRHKKTRQINSQCYAYIVTTKDISGKLQVDKCKLLRVPTGPLLAKLKEGEDICLEDGTVIKSSDVVSPTQAGKCFVVVDCLSKDFIQSLINQKGFFTHERTSKPEVVVHFTPPEVVMDSKYQEWMSKFPPNVVHLAINSWNPFFYIVPPLKLAKLLRRIDDKIFKNIYHSFEPDSRMKETNLTPCTAAQIYQIYPEATKGLDSSYLKEDLNDISDEALADEIVCPEDLENEIQSYKEKVSLLPVSSNEYPAIVFMGTGSAQPSTYRNSSCILVEINPDTIIMLDCGEGSLGQIYRFYGLNAEQIIRKIKGVFITHFHADHQIGFLSFCLHQKELKCDGLYLFCSSYVERLYKTFSAQCESTEYLYNVINTSEITNGLNDQAILRKLGLKHMQSCRVQHCVDSFGVTFITAGENSKKITYSGDALPSKTLVTIGKNSDLLIHEATFDDEFKDVALIKNHSTTSQAVLVGQEMKAKFIILTHFSQRYYKAPVFPDNLPPNVAFAFDNMRVEFDDFPRLPLMTGAIKQLFYTEIDSLTRKGYYRNDLTNKKQGRDQEKRKEERSA